MNYNRSLALLGALALGVQLTFAWTQFGLSADNLRQLGAAQNWVDGYGVVVRHFDPWQENQERRRPALHWAPGFSVAVGTLQKIGMEPLAAVRLLNLLASVIYLAAWFAWLVTLRPSLGDPLTLAGGLLAVTTFLPLQTIPSVDGLSLAVFLALAWAAHGAPNYSTWWEWGLAGALSIALVSLRYAYWPLILLLAVGVFRPRRSVLIFLALAALAAALYFQRVSQPGRDGSLHWDNLFQMRPFPAYAFGVARATAVVAHLRSFSDEAVNGFLRVWGLVVGLGCLWGAGRGLWRREDRAFHLLSLGTVAVTVGTLALASLLIGSATNVYGIVTPVKEIRYYAACVPFLTLGWLLATARGAIPRPLGWAVVGFACVWGVAPRWFLLNRPDYAFSQVERFSADRYEEVRRIVRGNRAQGKPTLWVATPPLQDYLYAVASGAVSVDPKVARQAAVGKWGPLVYNRKEFFSRPHETVILQSSLLNLADARPLCARGPGAADPLPRCSRADPP